MGSGDRRVQGAFVQGEVDENSNPEASRASRRNENARAKAILRLQKKGAASGSLGKTVPNFLEGNLHSEIQLPHGCVGCKAGDQPGT